MEPNTQNQTNNNLPPPTSHSHKKLWLILLLVVIIGAASTYGVYAWQHKKVNDSLAKNTSLSGQIADLNKKVAELQATKSTNPSPATALTTSNDLIPGRADVNRTDSRILVEAVWKFSLNPTEVWVDYGETPDNLAKSTEHATKNLGEGTGTYAYGNDLVIPTTSVKASTHYYYRVSAKVGGKTLNSAVASFITNK